MTPEHLVIIIIIIIYPDCSDGSQQNHIREYTTISERQYWDLEIYGPYRDRPWDLEIQGHRDSPWTMDCLCALVSPSPMAVPVAVYFQVPWPVSVAVVYSRMWFCQEPSEQSGIL